MLGLANVLLGGVAYGFVLFLMAGGLSITLGLMGFANMAHAAFAMLGGYTAALLVARAGWPFLGALAMGALTASAVGALFERFLFRRLYQASELEQVLLTIGVVYVAIATATYLVEHLPNCRSVLIPDAQHRAPEENPDGFLRLLVEFIDGLRDDRDVGCCPSVGGLASSS